MENKNPDNGKSPQKQATSDNSVLTAGVAATTSAATTLATSAALNAEEQPQATEEPTAEDITGLTQIIIDDIEDIEENINNDIIDIVCVYAGPSGWDEYDNPEDLIEIE